MYNGQLINVRYSFKRKRNAHRDKRAREYRGRYCDLHCIVNGLASGTAIWGLTYLCALYHSE